MCIFSIHLRKQSAQHVALCCRVKLPNMGLKLRVAHKELGVLLYWKKSCDQTCDRSWHLDCTWLGSGGKYEKLAMPAPTRLSELRGLTDPLLKEKLEKNFHTSFKPNVFWEFVQTLTVQSMGKVFSGLQGLESQECWSSLP